MCPSTVCRAVSEEQHKYALTKPRPGTCRGLGNVNFQVMDALAMEWPDESFDLVWACESGEHMPDKKKYVEEMVRVLKPGGTLVIACWCQREEGSRCTPPTGPLLHDTAPHQPASLLCVPCHAVEPSDCYTQLAHFSHRAHCFRCTEYCTCPGGQQGLASFSDLLLRLLCHGHGSWA